MYFMFADIKNVRYRNIFVCLFCGLTDPEFAVKDPE